MSECDVSECGVSECGVSECDLEIGTMRLPRPELWRCDPQKISLFVGLAVRENVNVVSFYICNIYKIHIILSLVIMISPIK